MKTYRIEINNLVDKSIFSGNVKGEGAYPEKHAMEKFLRRDSILSFLTDAAENNDSILFNIKYNGNMI